MEPIQLNFDISFYICESFIDELKLVTKNYDNITIKPYKAKCKYHHIKDPFENIKQVEEISYILGGCTVLKDALPNNFNLQKENNCFYMFAPQTLVDSYISNGGYIITPGWLNNWENYISELWGFDTITAQKFFGEFCKKLIFLDTLQNQKSKDQLKKFASFVDQPFEIVPIGLEYFELYIQNILKEEILKERYKTSEIKLQEAFKSKANYAMAFDLLSRLNEKHDEKEIIKKISEIFTILFAPEDIKYLSFDDDKTIDKFSSTNILKETYDYFIDSREDYILRDDGFALKLIYDNKTVGIINIENIAFKQYIHEYLNLAVSISGVCSLGIQNARSDLKTKEIEAQLTQHAKLVAMGEMMGAIAHQWRQPLNELNINIEMLEEYYDIGSIDEKFIEEFIEKNTNTIQFLSKTINDFSNFFRTNKQKTHFSIKESIENTLSIIAVGLQKNNISCKVIGDDIKIFGLSTEFQQVILNIINNAKDAIIDLRENKENFEGKISINILTKENTAIITIEDNGGGIPNSVISRLFEPYFTTKEQGKGVGMGLYISKMIIEETHNGELNVKNSDIGAIFTIKLGIDNG